MGKLPQSAGFSLVELMVAVAIMALLAAIAIPNFSRFSMRAKASESSNNLAAIRTCEVSYEAENDDFMACAATPDGGGTSDARIAWDSGTGGGMQEFEDIGFNEPKSPVRYRYQVISDGTYFLATASGDLDDDDRDCVYSVDVRSASYPTIKKNAITAAERAAIAASADEDGF